MEMFQQQFQGIVFLYFLSVSKFLIILAAKGPAFKFGYHKQLPPVEEHLYLTDTDNSLKLKKPSYREYFPIDKVSVSNNEEFWIRLIRDDHRQRRSDRSNQSSVINHIVNDFPMNKVTLSTLSHNPINYGRGKLETTTQSFQDKEFQNKVPVNKKTYPLVNREEGRKKKHKEKHIAMMGIMMFLATLAQMYLGKVILIAGAAFIMAKISLLVSLASSFKKGYSVRHGGNTEHVILSNGFGDHGYSSDAWHGRMQQDSKLIR